MSSYCGVDGPVGDSGVRFGCDNELGGGGGTGRENSLGGATGMVARVSIPCTWKVSSGIRNHAIG